MFVLSSKLNKKTPKSNLAKADFDHSAGSTKLDQPRCEIASSHWVHKIRTLVGPVSLFCSRVWWPALSLAPQLFSKRDNEPPTSRTNGQPLKEYLLELCMLLFYLQLFQIRLEIRTLAMRAVWSCRSKRSQSHRYMLLTLLWINVLWTNRYISLW